MPKRKFTKKDVNKVLLVHLPNNKRARWRWITQYNEETERFYAKTPKIGVLIRDLSKKRSKDYGKERILPVGTLVR
jgi:hypothetical protein